MVFSVIIFRYLAKEIYTTLIALTGILLLVFMSNQFVRYLSRAASGEIPIIFILKLMLLEIPNLAGLLLPLGFYMAIMVAYGRLYADSEMTVLRACGYGEARLLKHTFGMSLLVFFAVFTMTWWVNPAIVMERVKLLRTSGIKMLVQTVVPQRFRAISDGREVFYVEEVDRETMKAKNVFFARLDKKSGNIWDVLWAGKAEVNSDSKTNQEYLVFKDGQTYRGVPGQADYTIAAFGQYRARLPRPIVGPEDDIRAMKSDTLLHSSHYDSTKIAELQWRISVPLMVLTLTLVAVPLCRVGSRSGKYAKLLPAVLLYIVYANFMFITRAWLLQNKIPAWLGMWWIHIVVAIIGLGLLWRNRVKLSCA